MWEKLKHRWFLRKAIRTANRAFLDTGKRHFVIRVAKGKLIVVNNSFVKYFNKKFNANTTFIDLQKNALYQTPLNGRV